MKSEKYTLEEMEAALDLMDDEYQETKRDSTEDWNLCQLISIACMKDCIERKKNDER